MSAVLPNHSLKEEIRAYWSERAAMFDGQPGHGIQSDTELAQWQRLLSEALGSLEGRHVLDLACGTGEVSRVALSLGARVTGIDFAEPMIVRARVKHGGQNWQGWLDDVESLTSIAPSSVDAAVTRHLVWTLIDPAAAFAAWHRVLKPGGRVLIIDGNWVRRAWPKRVLDHVLTRVAGEDTVHRGVDMAWHRRIIADVHYRDGLTATQLAADLKRAHFTDIRSHALWPIYWSGMRRETWSTRLRLLSQTRFALSAVRAP